MLNEIVDVTAIQDDILVTDMEFGEVITGGGIIIRSDDGKNHGIKPRWGKVYRIGPSQHDVKIGDWVLVEHGRWTRGIKIDDGNGERFIRKISNDAILVVADHKPNDVYYADVASSDSPFEFDPTALNV